MFRYKKVLVSMGVVGMTIGIGLSPAHARTLDEVQNSGVLKIITNPSQAPHSFKDPQSNELVGIMVDVAKAVGQYLDVELDMMTVPFDGLVPALSAGRGDFLSAPLFITEKRAEVIDFTSPLYGWGEGILVQEGSNNKYEEFSDLSGKKVGVLEGSVQYDMLRELKGTSIATYPDYPSLLMDLRAGRVDATLVDPPSVMYAIQKDSVEGLTLVKGYTPVNHWNIGGAVEKGNAELHKAIEDIIADMKAKGELQEILDKWGAGDLASK